MGTLAAVPLYLLLCQLPLWWYLAVVIAGFGLGVVICSQASKLLQVHDHGGIVWDEIIGYWLTMVLAPPGWWWVVVGFVLFRVFDILKPWPISVADKKVHGGFGIMLDDVLAAVYALICLQVAAWLTVGYTAFG
jgi:phosphatidylglycerophosphatase A